LQDRHDRSCRREQDDDGQARAECAGGVDRRLLLSSAWDYTGRCFDSWAGLLVLNSDCGLFYMRIVSFFSLIGRFHRIGRIVFKSVK
jgi:hypothetical protein